MLLLLDANYLAASISFSRPSVGSGCKFKFGVLPFRTTLAAVLFRHPRLDVIEFALGTLGLTHSLTHTHYRRNRIYHHHDHLSLLLLLFSPHLMMMMVATVIMITAFSRPIFVASTGLFFLVSSLARCSISQF